MGSGLESTRDHAATMAVSDHLVTCCAPSKDRWGWTTNVSPAPDCAGCMPESDRMLWAQIANEITAHLDRHVSEDLFGDVSEEPAADVRTHQTDSEGES